MTEPDPPIDPPAAAAARALAQRAASDAVNLLADVVRFRQGSVFVQVRAAEAVLQAAGLLRPPAPAPTTAAAERCETLRSTTE